VCIANWNCRELLRDCLESLLDPRQEIEREIIVVDNGSTDGAAEMVAHEYPGVVLQCNPANFGFARANNQAAERASGRYLFFLNNDTVVPPGALRDLVAYADAHPGVGLVGPRLRDPHGQTQVSYRRRPSLSVLLHRTSLLRWTGLFRRAYRRYRRRDFEANGTRPVELLMGAALLVPRDIFFDCGAWDESFTFGGEDLDLSFQIGRRYPVIYHPEVEIIHYGRMSTRQHIGFASSHMTAGFARYLRKTGCPAPALWFYKLVIVADAPVQLVAKALQYLWRKFHGRYEAAERSLLACWGFWHFLAHGLWEFWKA
jgi:GT2 family glycosyltransferase